MEKPERKSQVCSRWETVVYLGEDTLRWAAPGLPFQLIRVVALTWPQDLDTPPFKVMFFTNTSWLIMLIDCHKQYRVKDYQYPLPEDPEQIGITKNAFPLGVRRHILKVAGMKVGRSKPNQHFPKSHVMPMGNSTKIYVFQFALYKRIGKNFWPIFQPATFNMPFWRLHGNAWWWCLFILAWVQPTWILGVLHISDRTGAHQSFTSNNRELNGLSSKKRWTMVIKLSIGHVFWTFWGLMRG